MSGRLLLFSPVCPHLTFFSPCAPLSFFSHDRTTSVVSLSFSWMLAQLLLSLYCVHFRLYPSLSLRTSISASSSHLLLVVLLCPLVVAHVCTMQQSWSDKSFENISLQFHWHSVTQHTTASLPVTPCYTDSFRLCVIYVAVPPVSPTLQPKYLK